MKKSRVLAMMLVVVMAVATMSTAVFAVEPPANSKVRVVDKTLTKTFEAEKVWDIWDTEGNFGSYTAGGNLNITGGVVPFIMLDGFGGGLAGFDEMVIKYKTSDELTVQLRERYANKWSEVVTLDATGSDWAEATISSAQFVSDGMTADDLATFRSAYNATTNAYDTAAMLYLGSSNATIESINCYWYSYSSESNQVAREISEDFTTTTWGSWGKWTGGGTNSVECNMEWKAGEGENGGNALVITGGNTGAGSYAGGQFAIPNSFDLTAVDAIRYRYKATAGINVYFNRAYQISNGETLPASEVETVKGLLGADYSNKFDENGKNISGGQWKWETKSGGVWLEPTNGQWTTVEIPISKFGSEAFLSRIKTAIINQSFGPCYHVRFEGCCYGADTSKYFAWGGITGVWYEKLPTMSALSFDVNGEEDVEYLDIGTTNVNVELKNDAAEDINGSVLVAALYDGNKLLDIDVKVVTTPALGTSKQTLSVTLDADEVTDDHELRVMLWDGADSMNQITNLAYIDAWGYATAE